MMNQQAQGGNPFQMWTDMYSKWSESWAGVAAAGPSPFSQQPTNPFFQGFTAPQPPDPMKLWNDMLQQYANFWSSFWEKNSNVNPSADVYKAAEKQWAEQLESQAKTFAETMSTETFAKGLGKFMEQSLYWSQKQSDAVDPQIDSMLKTWNIPSRNQMDRLFERVIGLEDQLSDIEQQNTENRKGIHLVQETLEKVAQREDVAGRLEHLEEMLKRLLESQDAGSPKPARRSRSTDGG